MPRLNTHFQTKWFIRSVKLASLNGAEETPAISRLKLLGLFYSLIAPFILKDPKAPLQTEYTQCHKKASISQVEASRKPTHSKIWGNFGQAQ